MITALEKQLDGMSFQEKRDLLGKLMLTAGPARRSLNVIYDLLDELPSDGGGTASTPDKVVSTSAPTGVPPDGKEWIIV